MGKGDGSSLLFDVTPVADITAEISNYDSVLIIAKQGIQVVSRLLENQRKIDAAFENQVSCLYSSDLNCSVIYSPCGELDGDYDDVRNYMKAAGKAMARALSAGAQSPVIVLPECHKFHYAGLATLLGAFQELYVPIQFRDEVPEKKVRVKSFGVYMENAEQLKSILEIGLKLESGLFVARDIGGGDPERMAPQRVVEYLREVFPAGSPVTMNVIGNAEIFKSGYPLFNAVNRAAHTVERHRGRIIFLEYKPPNPAKKTLAFVGKGVTYDTGGADVKAGGHMAGMSRDKCGAAAVAGLMKYVADTKPADVHVMASLCMVRNSIGEESYVADEIITSRAGIRVRVGNTDAEGRMCMADSVAQYKEMITESNLPNAHIYTVATLTGHACMAVGDGYSVCIDNGPARAARHSYKLKEASEIIGDPFEISTLRNEDFEFHRSSAFGEDLLSCNNLPSSQTPRGSITPAAFIMLAAGLDKHGLTSEHPIKFSHLDMAAASGYVPDIPTGSPLLALVKMHFDDSI